MVQSYLKKVGHRTFTANKKGGNREFFPHFPSPFTFLIATTKNCHVGIAKELFFLWLWQMANGDGYGRWRWRWPMAMAMAMAFDLPP